MKVMKYHHAVTFLVFSRLLISLVSAASSNPLVLRFRLSDGSIQKVSVPSKETILRDVLDSVRDGGDDDVAAEAQINGKKVDTSLSLSDLKLKNGALLTMASNTIETKRKGGLQKKAKPKEDSTANRRFDPFPDLARDYVKAKQQAARRRTAGGGLSYGDLATMQSNLFCVEPQPTGPLLRVYMCRNAAERFQSNAIVKNAIQNRCGILFGTLQKERVKTDRRVSRTSLSTPLSGSDYCQVAKVHAIWEPPRQKTSSSSNNSIYDARKLILDAQVLRVAGYLGLRPVGWIFTYSDKMRCQMQDSDKDDGLPVLGRDVQQAAQLQVETMKNDIVDGARFVTLSMNAESGATEAFQMSDVAVQMVAQDIFDFDSSSSGHSKYKKGADIDNPRHVNTKHPVIVDGKETTNLDSVLLLVNTALLSHEGSYTSAKSSTKKNGTLSNKTLRLLVKALDKKTKSTEATLSKGSSKRKSDKLVTASLSSDEAALKLLSDLQVLLAVDHFLTEPESAALGETVRKWARGQRKGTELSDALRQKLLRSLVQ